MINILWIIAFTILVYIIIAICIAIKRYNNNEKESIFKVENIQNVENVKDIENVEDVENLPNNYRVHTPFYIIFFDIVSGEFSKILLASVIGNVIYLLTKYIESKGTQITDIYVEFNIYERIEISLLLPLIVYLLCIPNTKNKLAYCIILSCGLGYSADLVTYLFDRIIILSERIIDTIVTYQPTPTMDTMPTPSINTTTKIYNTLESILIFNLYNFKSLRTYYFKNIS